MDRRRFIPRSEGMETRMMLSTASPTSVLTGGLTPASGQILPVTVQDKLHRIERLPGSLRTLSPNRFLPKDVISEIQVGLTQMVSSLHPAPSNVLASYNNAMRDIVSRPSLRPQDAQVLNNAFISVLDASGAKPDVVGRVATAMNTLVTKVDTASIQPVFLATNDYAFVLQLAQVVGQPMPAPSVPSIAKGSGTQVQARQSVSTLSQPTFIGNYQDNAMIQIFNQDTGQVLGSGRSNKNGQYKIELSPLELGTYRLRARAVDAAGHLGNPSQFFTLSIVPPKSKTPPKAEPAVQVAQATPHGPADSMKPASSSIRTTGAA